MTSNSTKVGEIKVYYCKILMLNVKQLNMTYHIACDKLKMGTIDLKATIEIKQLQLMSKNKKEGGYNGILKELK